MRFTANRASLTAALALSVVFIVLVQAPGLRAGIDTSEELELPRVFQGLAGLGLQGSLADTKCTFEALTAHSFLPQDDALYDHVSLLTSTLYFRIFKVDLSKACPFWGGTAATCTRPDCSVLVCDPEQIPACWRGGSRSAQKRSTPNMGIYPHDSAEAALGRVERPTGSQALPPFFAPYALEDESAWTAPDSDELSEYVDLTLNPEGFTGYQGQHIWDAVYRENCFRPQLCSRGATESSDAADLIGLGSVSTSTPVRPAACREERVFYRCVSGIHASINVHIARRYLFGRNRWGHHTRIYRERLRKHPERIENLYFVYALVLRALNKAAPSLAHRSDYWTGNETEDARTRHLVEQVLRNPLIRGPVNGCTTTFAEHEMFRGCCANCLVQFRAHFRNISKIMDCVGCEKCRLWGKLQFLGLGTAFKILFAEPSYTARTNRSDLDLTRNEVVALINLLKNLCLSIRSTHEMEWIIGQEAHRQRLWLCLVAAVLCGLGSILIRHLAGDILSYRGQIRRIATERRLKRNC